MRVQCNTCKGEYDTVTTDGLAYYHVCPPVSAVRATRADGSKAIVAIDKLEPTDTIRVQRAGKPVDTTIADLQPEDTRLEELTVDRPQARDERPTRVDEKTIGMVSTGTGITRVETPTDAQPDAVIL